MADRDQEDLIQQVAYLENIVRPRLTKEALQRYGNIKVANPEMAVQLLLVVHQFISKGEVETVNDTQLKEILLTMQPKRKEMKINRM
ncbi:hypothetical protein HZB02_01635 [Candidatus Woesearchaeota archaeon]|nr:hypothetical protein [Candidatus Woesearchaeota archaeon]